MFRNVSQRLANKSDKAVRQLVYGGGKTHTRITLLQFHNGPDNLPAVGGFVQAIGLPAPNGQAW